MISTHVSSSVSSQQPVLFIPHGGGPCFFMEWSPADTWNGLAEFLRGVAATLPARPKAIVLVSAHWQTPGFSATAAAQPGLIYDYYGFPEHTYQLTYPAPGAPALAERIAALIASAGFESGVYAARGFDHGMFIPLKVMFPEADIPVVQLSLREDLDPAAHLAMGETLAALRAEGVLIIGSGMSFHNMRGYGDPHATEPSKAFDAWLADAAGRNPQERATLLNSWADAPAGRYSHPREEHLLPLMVAAGASESVGERIYAEVVMKTALSAFRFA